MALSLDAAAAQYVIPETMRAAVLFGPRDIRPVERRVPRPGLDEVLVKVAMCGACGTDLKIYADVYVTFNGTVDTRSDAVVFDGTPDELVGLLTRWQRLGLDGFRLRPAVNATDLPVIVDEVVPLLQRANVFRTAYRDGEQLRTRLGLPVADNRYAKVEPT